MPIDAYVQDPCFLSPSVGLGVIRIYSRHQHQKKNLLVPTSVILLEAVDAYVQDLVCFVEAGVRLSALCWYKLYESNEPRLLSRYYHIEPFLADSATGERSSGRESSSFGTVLRQGCKQDYCSEIMSSPLQLPVSAIGSLMRAISPLRIVGVVHVPSRVRVLPNSEYATHPCANSLLPFGQSKDSLR
jgi:hypothetical protein